MTKKLALLRAINDLDEGMLSDALTYRAPAVHRLPRWLPAVAAAILVLTVCSAAALSWDARFLDSLSPSQAIMEKYDEMLDPVQVTEEYDDLTLTVTQTLGDAYNMYIALDVTFHEHVELPKAEVYIHPQICFYKAGTKTERDEKDHGIPGSGTYGSAQIDPKTRTAHFLIKWTNQDGEFLDHPITLELYALELTDENGRREPWIMGSYSVTWQPHNIGTTYQWDLMKGEECVGKVGLSSLSLTAGLLIREIKQLPGMPENAGSRDYFDGFFSSIHIVMKDGNEFTQYGGSTAAAGTGYLDTTIQFREILDLDQVAYLEIAGYRLELD